MKKALFTILFSVTFFISFAAHLKGGWMYYEYLGPGTNDPSKLKYSITLKLYMICNASSAQIQDPVGFTIFSAGNNQFLQDIQVPKQSEINIQNHPSNPCIINEPTICYKIITYQTTIELAVVPDGYIVAKQQCCRISGISNIANSANVGATYTVTIPGTNAGANAEKNSSAQFAQRDTLTVCDGNFFTFDFSASDPDGDQLKYSFVPAFDGATSVNPQPTTSSPPPFANVPYLNPFSGTQPMGSSVTINPNTGIVSGIAPASGEYVVCVAVDEFKNGVVIARVRKEIHLFVANCFTIKPQLAPEFTTCDGFNLTFQNGNSNPQIANYFWTFGDPFTGSNDTSLSATPTHLFSDTGVFIVKLVVNKGLPCSDSATQIVKVYPGFFPGFKWTGLCTSKPIQFTDTTKTNFGTVNTWRWEFGNPATLSDTSHLQNPSYTYPVAGNYDVSFIVSNSKGCIDTVTQSVPIVDNPTLATLFRDTTYCGKDTIQLHTSSTLAGNFTWVPAVNIIGANTSDPFVFPTATTTYHVTMNASGCIGTDSVTVRPQLDLVTNVNASPASICEEDTLTLTATSNHSPVQFLWNPAASVVSPASAITKAFPTANTTYTVTARWGNNCVATNNKAITVKPLAIPNAGPDAAICPGANGVVLNASGGDNYTWTPSRGLSAVNISNPRATPDTTTLYIVSVGVTGCTKRRADSILVTVRPLPPLTVTNDTLMCAVVDTMQLNATGTGNIFWTPNNNINNQNSASPLVSPRSTTKYYATLTDAAGCINIDSVLVSVKDSVTLYAGNDTSICRTDAATLRPVSDALHYLWTPGQPVLSSDTAKYPVATPLTTTTFRVIANIGKCQSQGLVTIKVAPYPVANAIGDTTICFGGTAQLNATGGSIYKWSPTFFLNDPNIPDPLSNPNRSLKYMVNVSDTLGCPKIVTDSVLVKVYPKIIADAGPRDTTVVVNQTLQLTATGGQFYLWSPSTDLNDPKIADPIAILRSVTPASVDYIVSVSTASCSATDTITVHVYKVDPGLYVPNAFTPNGDGNNDVFRPIPIGMKRILYFQVFNRWGVLVFSTSEQMKGWDGNWKGKPQDSAVFVWIVEGIDYQGLRIKQKGTVVLIR